MNSELSYKKKNLKFSGYTRELKRTELHQLRGTSRHKRLSSIRDIQEELETPSKVENTCPIKVAKTGIPSRGDMLKRWKEEKLMKQQRKQLTKVPVFKVGIVPKSTSSLIAPLIQSKDTEEKSNCSYQKSQSFKIPHVPQLATSRTNIRKQESQITKEPVKLGNSKAVSKSLKSPIALAPSLKPPIQKPKLASSSQQLRAPSQKSTSIHPKQILSTARDVKTVGQISKPINPVSKLPVGAKKSSNLKIISSGPKLPVIGIKQPQKLPNTKPELSRGNQKYTIKEPIGFPKKCVNQPKPDSKKTAKNNATLRDEKWSEPSEIFSCDISHIEPDKSVRNSFAPSNFIFCPPAEISSFSFFNPSSIFLNVKNQLNNQRTSSPIKLPDQTSNDCSQESKETDMSSTSNVSEREKQDGEIFLKIKQNEIEETFIKEKQNTDDFLKTPNETIDALGEKISNSTEDVFVEEKQEGFAFPIEKQNKIEYSFAEEKQNAFKDFSTEENENKIIDLETEDPKKISLSLAKPTPSPKASKLKTLEDEMHNSINGILVSSQNKITSATVENGLPAKTPIEICVPNCPVSPKTCVLLPINSHTKNYIEVKANCLNESCDSSADDFSLCESLKSFQFHESVSSETTSSVILSNTKNFKKSLRPELESINESIEIKSLNNTPKSGCKKKQLDANFTPRRSARLSQKLRKSSSFESILDVENSLKKSENGKVLKPKNTEQNLERTEFDINARNKKEISQAERIPHRKESLWRDCLSNNVRRSQRLSRKFSNSFESLLSVERPSIMGSLDDTDEELPLSSSSNLTYDFDNLLLEDLPQPKKVQNTGTPKRVSLLYSPQKRSTRYSVKENLMSFSPP